MVHVLLRASGRSFDPDSFLHDHALDADTIWRAGELGPGGRVRPESGFHLTIVNAATPRDVVTALREWLDLELDTLHALAQASIAPVIEIRLTAHADPTMIATLTLEAGELSLLAALGISLRISTSAAPPADGPGAMS